MLMTLSKSVALFSIRFANNIIYDSMEFVICTELFVKLEAVYLYMQKVNIIIY